MTSLDDITQTQQAIPTIPIIPELPINLSLTLKRHHRYNLNDIEHMATFTCKTSKHLVEVDWYKDEKHLRPSGKYEIRHIGREHYLTVHDLCKPDYGDYVVEIGTPRVLALAAQMGLFTLFVFNILSFN